MRWCLITYNRKYYQSLKNRIIGLGATPYAPEITTLIKRNDRPSCKKRTTPLFPGYMFVHMADYHVRPILDLDGCLGFVRHRDKEPCSVKENVIEGLRELLLLPCRGLDRFVYDNLPSELEKSLLLIIKMPTEKSRLSAFSALIEQSVQLANLSNRPGARVYSLMHPLSA